ncbi:Spore protein YabP [Clostridiales bacterium CHKCI001]|nr:Spore protein YabP [Clostridiales bacterium CHKCI001]
MEEKQKISTNHRIMMHNRKECQMTGVRDVISFTAEEALLETEMGILQVKGANLHMSRLTLEKEEIDIDGEIASLIYTSADHYSKPGESFLKRIFR